MSAQPRAFRATPEAWIGHLLLPLAFFTLFTFTVVNRAGVNAMVGGLVLSLVVLVLGVRALLPMLRDVLHLDRRSMRGSLGGRTFEVYWTEVIAAWIVRQDRQELLCLGTQNGTLIVPLRYFDGPRLWEYVRAVVSPAALHESAIQRLPDYREWAAARKTALDAAAQPGIGPRPVTDHWIMQVIGWSGITFFMFGALDSYARHEIVAALILLGLAGLSVLMLLSWGITEFTQAGVERSTLFGCWHIAWDEVRRVEIDPADLVMVLVGDDRALALPGPAVWNQSGKPEALAMLLAQVEKYNIPLERTPFALFKISRNTRQKK